MKPSFDPSDDLLLQYLTGTASATEQQAIEQWAAEFPDGRNRLGALAEVMERHRMRTRHSANAIDVQSGWNRVQQALDTPVSPIPSRPAIRTRRHIGAWASAVVGAVGVIAVVLGVVIIQPSAPEPFSPKTYTTISGQRATITLLDGSRVTLAPETSVELSGHTITVRGLAQFQMQPQTGRPITVLTNNAEARILGTTFTVRHYPGELTSQVVVADGKVGVRALHSPKDQASEAIVTANMLANVRDSSVDVRRDITIAEHMGWTEGNLIFNETVLRDVIAELSRAYATEITVADSVLANKVLTMRACTDSQPLSLILELIGRATESHAVRSGDRVVLVPGRVAPRTERLKRPLPQEIRYGR